VWSLVVTETQVFYSKKLSLQSGQKVAPETGREERKEGRKRGEERGMYLLRGTTPKKYGAAD